MAEHAARGKKLAEDSKYPEAIEQFTAALRASPTSPDYLVHRATAYQRSQQFPKALQDAERAVVFAKQRAKKELIIQAQLRRGIALFNLQRYGDAELAFSTVKRMDEKEKSISMWIQKTEMKLRSLPEGDEKAMVTITETPDLDHIPAAAEKQASAANSLSGSASNDTATFAATAPSATPSIQQTPVEKIRHEWYQSSENIYFTLLAKGVPKNQAKVDITEHSMTISFPTAESKTYDFTVDPFFALVQPDKCSTHVRPTKVEVILIKATSGQKWSALEGNTPLASKVDSAANADQQDHVKRAVFTASQPQGPAYPTSSKSGPKDWDKVVTDLGKGDASDKAADGDDDEAGGDDTNRFFKKLFKGSSPDVQRAMMKSYTESNGTALSTNWDEVRKGKVETVPPDSMEEKKW